MTMSDPTPRRSLLGALRDRREACRLARAQRWLDRRQYPNYGESENR